MAVLRYLFVWVGDIDPPPPPPVLSGLRWQVPGDSVVCISAVPSVPGKPDCFEARYPERQPSRYTNIKFYWHADKRGLLKPTELL